jgi:DNA end-binding protein Ku
MEEMERVGVGRFVMRTKEYLTTVRPLGPGLALETMFFEDEIRDVGDVPGDVKKVAVSARELQMAQQLIRSLEAEWQPKKFEDTYRDRVMDLIRKKARGEEIVQEVPPEPEGEVVDLMEALKASLASGHKPGARASNGRRPPQSRRRAGTRGHKPERHRTHA